VGPGNHVLDGVQPSCEGAIFRGGEVGDPLQSIGTFGRELRKKTSEPIGMSCGSWAQIGPRNVGFGSRSPMGRDNLEGERRPIIKYRDALP